MTGVQIASTDAVGAVPLCRERAPGVADAEFGVVDVGSFGGQAVEFEDFEVAAEAEVVGTGGDDVKAAKMKAWVAVGELV